MGSDLELIARDEALGAMRSALALAEGGRGRLVLVTGEPGIGKSALSLAVAREAEARGASVVFGRAWATPTPSPSSTASGTARPPGSAPCLSAPTSARCRAPSMLDAPADGPNLVSPGAARRPAGRSS